MARGDGGDGALDAGFRGGALADGVYASEEGFAGVAETGAMGRGVSAESEDAVADAVDLGHGAGEVLVVFRADALHLLGALGARGLERVERGGGVRALAKGEARERGGVVVIGCADRGVEGGARLHQERATKGGVGGVLVVARVGVREVDASPRSTAAASRAHAAVRSDADSATSAPRAAVSSMARQTAGWNRGGGRAPAQPNDRLHPARTSPLHRRARDDRGEGRTRAKRRRGGEASYDGLHILSGVPFVIVVVRSSKRRVPWRERK